MIDAPDNLLMLQIMDTFSPLSYARVMLINPPFTMVTLFRALLQIRTSLPAYGVSRVFETLVKAFMYRKSIVCHHSYHATCLFNRCLTWMGTSASGLARPEVEMVISSVPAELQ